MRRVPRLAMVNQQDMINLETKLTDAFTEMLKDKEITLLEKISKLELENQSLKTEINIQSQTSLTTIKAWIDGLTNSIAKMNREIGTITYRLDTEEKRLTEERESVPEINTLEDRVAYLSTEVAELKVFANGQQRKKSGNTEDWSQDTTWGNGEGQGSQRNAKLIREQGIKLEELSGKVTYLEDYSRRDNLKFFGIKEESGETWSKCEAKITDIIENEMGLKDLVDQRDWGFVRAHRVGKFNADAKNPRPIVVKFKNWKVKNEVLMNSETLKVKDIYNVCEDFSKKTDMLRKQLYDTHCKNDKSKKLVYNRVVSRTPRTM